MLHPNLTTLTFEEPIGNQKEFTRNIQFQFSLNFKSQCSLPQIFLSVRSNLLLLLNYSSQFISLLHLLVVSEVFLVGSPVEVVFLLAVLRVLLGVQVVHPSFQFFVSVCGTLFFEQSNDFRSKLFQFECQLGWIESKIVDNCSVLLQFFTEIGLIFWSESFWQFKEYLFLVFVRQKLVQLLIAKFAIFAQLKFG